MVLQAAVVLLLLLCCCVVAVVAVLAVLAVVAFAVGDPSPLKNSGSHIDASLSRQPLVKGERLVRYEVNAVMVQAPTGDWEPPNNVPDAMFQCSAMSPPGARETLV